MKILFLLCAIIHCTLCRKAENENFSDEKIEDTFAGNDPKENYFRYMRAYNGGGGGSGDVEGANIPRPGGFKIYYADNRKSYLRDKRDAVDGLEVLGDDGIGKPLELEILDTENVTDINYDSEPKNDLVINDFIRFKRDAAKVTEKSTEDDADGARPKREHERNAKMLLSAGEPLPEGSREPRGATKDHWIKQPYPVQTTDPHRSYDDNLSSASEIARAPRVHFVTQRRSESAPPLVYHSYEREGRSRQSSRDLDRDLEPGYFPRPPRHYNPQNIQNNPYRPDRPEPPYYYRGDDRDYDSRYYDEERRAPVFNKQRRIIYYATLPEVVRSPPNVDLRDRYNNRDPYDNRYVTSPPVSVGPGEPYRYGNRFTKSRFDEPSKAAYPTKVSTDVNVREIKKNPERRIYPDSERRYPYKPNYHQDDVYDRNK